MNNVTVIYTKTTYVMYVITKGTYMNNVTFIYTQTTYVMYVITKGITYMNNL